MKCQRCQSPRILEFSGKCSDTFGCSIGEKEHDGYVPYDVGIGGGDYVEGKVCLECGQMQGVFPLPPAELEGSEGEQGDPDGEEEVVIG